MCHLFWATLYSIYVILYRISFLFLELMWREDERMTVPQNITNAPHVLPKKLLNIY